MTIVAVGGSTTESYLVSAGKDWPAVLGRRLSDTFDRVWVNNAGISGHTTYGRIQLVRQHIARLGPKVAVFLVGLNDTRFSDYTKRYDARLNEIYGDPFKELWINVRLWLARRSYVVALIYNLERRYRPKQSEGIDLSLIEVDYQALPGSSESQADIEAVLSKHRKAGYFDYAERLRTLIRVSREAGIIPVFATQPTLYGPAIDPVTGLDLGKLTGHQWQLIRTYNQILLEVGEREGVLVADVASEMEKSTEYFYDFWHYSAAGSARVGEIIHRKLCPYLAERFSEYRRAPCRG